MTCNGVDRPRGDNYYILKGRRLTTAVAVISTAARVRLRGVTITQPTRFCQLAATISFLAPARESLPHMVRLPLREQRRSLCLGPATFTGRLEWQRAPRHSRRLIPVRSPRIASGLPTRRPYLRFSDHCTAPLCSRALSC